jgi:predicted PurR-regulated permease PerM
MTGWIFFCVSLVVNGFFVWYLIEMIRSFTSINNTIEEYLAEVKQYEDHLEEVLQKDLFFDDPIIKSLLSHTTNLKEKTRSFGEGFSLDD